MIFYNPVFLDIQWGWPTPPMGMATLRATAATLQLVDAQAFEAGDINAGVKHAGKRADKKAFQGRNSLKIT